MEPQNQEMKAVEQFQLPWIIAIKDASQSSKIGHELAMFLKCPLLDENDISLALKQISSTTPTNYPDELAKNLPFEAICQLVSTQLSLKIKVIIKAQLSSPERIDRLDELARSSGARLIIINDETWAQQNDDYKTAGDIPKLPVAMNSFDAEKVVSDISSMFSNMDNSSDSKLLKPPSQDNLVGENERFQKTEQPLNDHLHALTLLDKPRKDKNLCKKCTEVVSSSCYQCVVCDEFILHKFCAESAPNAKVTSKNCPPFLTSTKPCYDFKEKHKCSTCEDFSYKCCDCLLQTHLNYGFVPTILYHSRHQHMLNFMIMPLMYNYLYLCCVCDKYGHTVSYKCFDCNYDVHVKCVLPSNIQIRNDQHPLFLTYQGDPAESCCDICKKKRERGQLFYQCEDCDFSIDERCVSKLSQTSSTLLFPSNH